MDAARNTRAVAFTPTGKKRARASPVHLFLLAGTASTLLGLTLASTSLPSSSSSEICPDETAACYDSPFCWDCVAQFADSPDFCLTDTGASECEAASALYCCSFDLSGQDCLGDAVTVDYFRCGLLEGSGCALSDSPCSGTSGSSPTPSSGSDDDPETSPSTTSASSEDSQTAPAPTTPPTMAPLTISPTETTSVVPSPVESDPPVESGPIPSTPSPVDVDRDIEVTNGVLARVQHFRALGIVLLFGMYVCPALSGWW